MEAEVYIHNPKKFTRLEMDADRVNLIAGFSFDDTLQQYSLVSLTDKTIELVSDSITLTADKVYINGSTTFDSLFTDGTTTIDGGKITTGTITADELNVTTLSSISSDLGDITGGSINIGNGNFVVNSNGQFTALNMDNLHTQNLTATNITVTNDVVATNITANTKIDTPYLTVRTVNINNGANSKILFGGAGTLGVSSGTYSQVQSWVFPDASGTIALTEDLAWTSVSYSAVPVNSTEVMFELRYTTSQGYVQRTFTIIPTALLKAVTSSYTQSIYIGDQATFGGRVTYTYSSTDTSFNFSFYTYYNGSSVSGSLLTYYR